MMKNKLTILFSISALLVLASGCSKDFLETNPSTQVSDQNLFKTLDGAQTVLNGTYRYLRSRSTDVETSGIISFQNGFDAAANDIIVYESQGYMQQYYGHLLAETRADGGLTGGIWNYFYTIIGNANNILSNLDQISGAQDRKDAIKGQAQALRAWSYFYLVRFYMHTYSIAKDMPGVPYYSEPGTIGKGREKISVIYENIVKDLTEAINLLGSYSRQYKTQINQRVAQGILAEVYLTMEDWGNAATTANTARTGFNLMTATEYRSGFNNWGLSEWMWAQHQTTDQLFGNITSFTLWANRTRGTQWTYDFYFVNDKFKDQFAATDVRSQFWLRTDRNLWTSDKFRDNSSYTGDVIMMRAAEMYLIEAEALARSGQDGKAKDILWMLQDRRSAVRSISSGQALIEEILVERRKELYGEGFAWFDLLRTLKPVQRTGDHTQKPVIPSRSWRFIFQIPTAELNTNNSIKPEDQNKFDGIY
ncbi:MAG TPA: RagB/SusD family nutrient uptake outer membrane protein [Flavitalea sp.]|nr:RagB/SusD family nutrient uptake outer membrane protein [Flavitalea sp.]